MLLGSNPEKPPGFSGQVPPHPDQSRLQKLAVRCGVDANTILDLFPADLLDEGIALKGNTVQRRIATASGKVFFKGGRYVYYILEPALRPPEASGKNLFL